MKRLAAGMTGAIVVALATAAPASPFFDTFQALCVNSRAAPAASIAAADQQGWMPVPDALLGSIASGGFDVSAGRIKTDQNGLQFMIVGAKSWAIDGVPMRMNVCGLGSMPKDSALRREVAGWVKVPRDPDMSKTTQDVYTYVERAGVRTLLRNPSDAQAETLLRQGDVRLMFVGEEEETSLLMFAVPTI